MWGIIDAAIRPREEWDRIGQSKVLWIVLQGGGLFVFLVVGFVLSLVYLLTVRPKLRAAS